MNIGIITQEGELVVPPFEHALAGCTLKRLLHLVQEVGPAVLWALPPSLADIRGATEEERSCQCQGVVIPDTGNRSLQLFNMPMQGFQVISDLPCQAKCQLQDDENLIHNHHLSHDATSA